MKESNIYKELKTMVDYSKPVWGDEILQIVKEEMRKRILITFDTLKEMDGDNTDDLDALLVELEKLNN